MIVKLNDRYIDTDNIEYISKVYISTYSTKTIAFDILLKNRIDKITFNWQIKTFNGETEESLTQKIDAIRNKLARKITPDIENLDATIDLKKIEVKQTIKQPIKKHQFQPR